MTRMSLRPKSAGRTAALIAVLFSGTAALAHIAVDEQMEDLSRRIAGDPDQADLYLKRAELHRALGALDVALEDFERCRRLDPDHTRVDLYVGRMWLDAGEAGRALHHLDSYIKHHSGDPHALGLRAAARLQQNRPLEAAGDYSEAIRLLIARGRTPPPDFYVGRSRALARAGGEHLDEALRGLQDGITALRHPITLEMEAIDIESRLGHVDEALRRLERLSSSLPRPELWLLRRGNVLRTAGRYEEAREAYLQAIESPGQVSSLLHAEILRALESLPENRSGEVEP